MITKEQEDYLINRWDALSKEYELKFGTKRYFEARRMFFFGVFSFTDMFKDKTEATPNLYFSIMRNTKLERT